MNFPTKITIFRIILSPLFFLFVFIPVWLGSYQLQSMIILLFLFALIEFSDLFDGILARKNNQVTDLGKVLDPFADVLSRITYFVSFVGLGIMPIWVLLIILYREFGVSFIRLLMAKRGVAFGARGSGKLKAWAYAVAGGAGLFVIMVQRFGLLPGYHPLILTIAQFVFITAGLVSLLSFIDYAVAYLRYTKETLT